MLGDLLDEATLGFLLLAATILAAGLVSRKKKSRSDFSLLMMLFVAGWLSTDFLSSFVGEEWESAISLCYMLILAGFLALMVRRLGWAITESGRTRLPIDRTAQEDK